METNTAFIIKNWYSTCNEQWIGKNETAFKQIAWMHRHCYTIHTHTHIDIAIQQQKHDDGMRSNNGIKCKQFVITLILPNLH